MAKNNNPVPAPPLPEVVVTASEMSNAIMVVASKLLEWHLIDSTGFAVLQRESRQMARTPHSLSWQMEIDRDEPVRFATTEDKNGRTIYPRLVSAGITVNQEQHDRPPFTALDIAIEIEDSDQAPVARWHVDLANLGTDPQPGPLTHLQYGGHFRDHRATDHPLKIPRWCHPPMDIVLLCEVMAANFYTDFWLELREDQSWCNAISLAQRLCYSAYLRKMIAGMSVSGRSLLHGMWAGEWA